MRELPNEFAKISLTALPPGERPSLLRAVLDGEPVRGLRLRPGVPLATVMEALPGPYEPVPWAKDGYILEQSSRAGSHALHAAGAYYLQEPSAMAPVGLLDVRPGQRVLDLCAAPGGKSAQIAALLCGEGVLVANECVPGRCRVLSRNIERMGVPNAVVVSAAPDLLASRWGAWFDRVLADAPCSGEGMFRREPEAIREWTPQSPWGCAARQRKILASAAALLRPGGTLVYSTCTFNEIENEGVVESFLREHPEYACEEMLRLWPHRVAGEGHFAARLVREGGPREMDAAGGLVPLGGILPEFEGIAVKGCLSREGDRYWAKPHMMPPTDAFRVLRPGLGIGRVRGSLCVPDHALAMAFPPDTWPLAYAADDVGAAQYLRGEPLEAPGAPRGWTVIHHRGMSLGWAKCAEGLLKNHLPKGLRGNASG